MSEEVLTKKQKEIVYLKIGIKSSFKNNLISDLVIHEYPKWSIYFKDGTEYHSFNFNAVEAGVLHKYLRENWL